MTRGTALSSTGFAGSGEMAQRRRILLTSLALILLSPAATSFDLPSRGCYWTESCQSKWFGGCGEGHVITDQSDDCNGLCGESSYPPCLPFHTHYHCCKPEIPKVTNRCAMCKNKLDFGDEYVCCSDCSEPYLIYKNSKLGYCNSGAELAVQLKPQEEFNWVAGPWMKCSSPCDGGVRYRDVGCFGSTEDLSIKHYPVDESRCSAEEMVSEKHIDNFNNAPPPFNTGIKIQLPCGGIVCKNATGGVPNEGCINGGPARQESCNVKHCVYFSNSDRKDNSQSGMSGFLVAFLVLLGLVAVGGLGFAGYTYYKRRNSAPTGFVYIMLEGYS